MYKYVGLVVVIIGILISYCIQQFKPKVKTPNELNPQYDYIIVGGGTAGCVLASRLSEDAKISVLVLEAGGEETDLFYSHIPGAAAFLQQTDFDWQYFTIPQSDCCDGLNDNQGRWPRGRVLGGSSILTYMHYARGNRADFDNWQALGNYEWGYKDVLPYFKKAENILIDRLKTSQYHGTDGPIDVTEGPSTVLGKVFVEAAHFLGYEFVDDYNGAQQEGFSRLQLAIKNGKRSSSASAYLRPVMHRSNLHVVSRAHVSKVIFNYNDEEKRTAGVEYEYKGAKHRVLTNREIILAAGAIGSPHILLMSGIGPKQQLASFGIQTIQDSFMVGKNLKDQIGLFLRYQMNESIGLDLENVLTLTGQIKAVLQYYLLGSGPLSTSPIEYTGYLKSSLTDSTSPNLQFYLLPGDPYMDTFVNLLNFNEDVAKSLHVTQKGTFSFSLAAILLRAESNGELKLQSIDPMVPPLIDPKYFHEETDLDVLFEGVKILDKFIKTPFMQKYGITYNEGTIAVCAEHEQWTDAYLKCLTRNRATTVYHPVGTCRMGLSIEESVVDAELKVHGIKGLRIVDASVFPTQISGNPFATVIMIAEKASDMIRTSKPLT